MTVYNISKLFTIKEINSFKKFLNTDKVQPLYSDYTNGFGVKLGYTYHSKRRKDLIIKIITNKCKTMSISILTNNPKINIKKSHKLYHKVQVL